MNPANKRHWAFFIWICWIGTALMAQEKELTLHDLIPGGKTYNRFVPRTLKQLQWSGAYYLYAKGDSLLAAVPGEPETVVLTRGQLNSILTDAGLPAAGNIPAFTSPLPEKTLLSFRHRNELLLLDWQRKELAVRYPLAGEEQHTELSPSGTHLAFTLKNNLYIQPANEAARPVTTDQEPGIVNGQAVHQREFGIAKGTFWSPSGKYLAFYRMDERMVTDYPLVNVNARCAKAQPIKYPMAGMKSHEVTVGIYNVQTGETIWLQTGTPKEKYLTNIAWSPDEKSIYIAEVNREQNKCQLVKYNALNGKRSEVLFTETHPNYVEPQHPVQFLPGDSTRLFIWQSQRDGYNHLYLYNTKGKLIRQLTHGEWLVQEVLGVDKQNVYLLATLPHPERPVSGPGMENNILKVNLADGNMEFLNSKQGVHTASLSPSGNYLIDRVTSSAIPHDIDLLRTTSGEPVKNLLSASDPFKNYTLPSIETGQLIAADGETELNYRIIKPAGLDETKKYPVIVYVYGGPHVQLINGSWQYGTRGWDLYMAQRGYIVFTVDSRGSANRGLEFENVIFRQLGTCEMEDQMKGIDYLCSLPYVDKERIGVHGWSYGGFMTTNLMLTYPDVFKVGVAGGPVIDWSRYEIMYGERYMDSPQDNPEGYKNSNLKEKAGNLKGRLLLIHGDVDPVVVWQHSLEFLKACVNAGTHPDYFVYPGHGHNVTGKDRPHLYEKITRYFDDFL
ncbi:MAG: S9 family peptidase [Tannerellaceae bacterium]|nr:S9 family peptidase [Tannerellaceae bacterium]